MERGTETMLGYNLRSKRLQKDVKGEILQQTAKRPVLADIGNSSKPSLTSRTFTKSAKVLPGLEETVRIGIRSTAVRPIPPSTTKKALGFETAVNLDDILSPRDLLQDYVDIDKADERDPQMCTQYVSQIYAHLRDTEQVRYRVEPNYMERVQRDINNTMRGILIDWLVEVAEEYKLSAETLHLAVNYLDRFLSRQQVQRGKLQLVGITCMLIAAKYEEIFAPQVNEFVYISDNTYSREEVIQMESLVLNTLKFDLAAASSNAFVRRFSKAAHADPLMESLASYIAELTMPEYGLLKYKPSQIAAASVSLALQTFYRPSWTATLQHYTGYSEFELRDCIMDVYRCHRDASRNQLQAIREKYSHSKFLRVSNIPPPPNVLLAGFN